MKRSILRIADTKCFFVIVISLSAFSFFFLPENTRAQSELDVVKNNWLQFSDVQNSLYQHISSQAYLLLEKREQKVAGLKTLSEWQDYQKSVRKILQNIVGPFPEKTPLNAKTVRIIDKKDYRIEHVIFESQPAFYITSSLFIPSGLKKNSKAPAIVYCSGHSTDGYRNTVYMHVILNLVKKGFIVFAFDPVGQGERSEYWDSVKSTSFLGGPTKEHSYSGTQAFISGSSQARYMIWDGIRSIDYLLTRKEVDPARIGITGRSGGGTQSAYIAAFDDRIYAAAPENYLTNFARLFQSIGPQDAEQNFFNGIVNGIDHPDFLIARAPKPALMITTTRDMFSIQGAMETEKEVARIYMAYGKDKNFSRVEDDAVHESTKKNREAMYGFFQEHLNNPGYSGDEETSPLTKEELRVTGTGQVATSLKGETVFSLNRTETEKLTANLPNSGSKAVIDAAKKLSGYVDPDGVPDPVFTGRIKREGYCIEKYFVKGEGDYPIPFLLFIPEIKSHKFLFYLHPSGKSKEASVGGEIEWFVRKGFNVIAPDLTGMGEAGPGVFRGDAYIDSTSHNIWYAAMLTGRSLTGIRAGDLVRLIRVVKKSDENADIYAIARKELCPVLLHAAAFEPVFSHIAMVAPFSSFRSVVMNHTYNSRYALSCVPGALKSYDLPELIAAIAPVKLLMTGVTDGNGKIINVEDDREMGIIKSGYRNKNADKQLIMVSGDLNGKLSDLYNEWIK